MEEGTRGRRGRGEGENHEGGITTLPSSRGALRGEGEGKARGLGRGRRRRGEGRAGGEGRGGMEVGWRGEGEEEL